MLVGPGSDVGPLDPARFARVAIVAAAAVAMAATAFDVGFSSRLGPGLLPYLAPVGDVAHGRTPLVDTASRGGWGAIDLLGAIFTTVPLGYGTLALVVSAAAAACALLMLALATAVVRPVGAAVVIAGAAVVVGALAGPVADAGAPSSGAMTLLIALLGAIAVVRGADQRGWRHVAVLSCALGVMWSAPTAALTIATVTAGTMGWQPRIRRGQMQRYAAACAAGVVAYAGSALARGGALPDPRLVLATNPLSASPGEPATTAASTALGLLTVLALGLAWWAWRRTPASASGPAASAVFAVGALAAPLAVHGLAAGAPVEIAHAAGLMLLLLGIVARAYGGRGTAAFALTVAAAGACAGTTLADRWQTSALYAAIPHQPLPALHSSSDAFDQSLRYNVRVLARRPLVSPDAVLQAGPLIGAATRSQDRLLVLLPGPQQAEALALANRGSMLPIGDPTTNDVVGRLRSRLDQAIAALPHRTRIVTRRDWLARSADSQLPLGDERATLQALQRLLTSFEARVLIRRSGLVVAELTRRRA